MPRSAETLQQDVLAIFAAGVDAVRSDRLVRDQIQIDADGLHIVDEVVSLADVRNILVVGAGKASAGVAEALEQLFDETLATEKNLTGLISVPENCVRKLKHIELRAGRPAGLNEPTEAGIAITAEILERVGSLAKDDLCICIITGGGSALLPAPIDGVTLKDKQFLTQELAARGANIEQLNTVRKQLSRIKGGGLAATCTAGRLVTLVISDVLGDPLDIIASGPTVPNLSTAKDALEVLQQFKLNDNPKIQHVIELLKQKTNSTSIEPACHVTNYILGNNALAVDAAGQEAVVRGYRPAMTSASASEGAVEEVAAHHVKMTKLMQTQKGPDCLITGGEPTVELVDSSVRGKGGRNQQLVLAALAELGDCSGLAFLSGGTDGEDGPTDATGAYIDEVIAAAAKEKNLDPSDYLKRNDAYHFFEPLGGLIKTGPTDTNVCDLRILVLDEDGGKE